MAFKFQINDDVRFIHDEELLKKAESFRPSIRKEEVRPQRIVDLVEDETKLNGIGVADSVKEIKYLKRYGLMRDDSLILDFGDHRVGTFQIDIDQTGSPQDAPLFLRLKFAEIPAELGAESGDYEGWLSRSWIQEELVHVDELPYTLKLPRRYSFRYVELRVIDTSPKWQAVFSNPLVIAESSADYSRLPSVELEDGELQKIYDVGVKTLAECMQDVFEDGPKRDRRLWLGDLRLQAQANYATFDNTALVKRCQVWMVLAHVMSEGENRKIMETMTKKLFPIKNIATPYMYHHIMEALFEAGLKKNAVELMKHYWGTMISLGADTYWEAFDPAQPDYSPYGSPVVNSYCHAWSCTPVYLIRRYLVS